MSDTPVTQGLLKSELERFSPEVMRPDFERVIEEFGDRMESRMNWNFQRIYGQLDRLQANAEEMNAIVGRIEAKAAKPQI